MCGIVGYVGDSNATTVLLDGLRKLEYRGYDSAGIAVFKGSELATIKSQGRLDDLESKIIQQGAPDSDCGIGHTRWATHGEPSYLNSHPHGNERISIVHNGIIENYMVLKQNLIQKGYLFESETDTEVILKLLDYYYQGDPFEAIRETMFALKGSYALGILFRDFPGKIFALRKDSPMIVGLGEREHFIASDIPAILKYTRDYYLIDENEIVILTKEQVQIWSLNQEPIQKEKLTATWDVKAAEKGGHPHFMIKEIWEQPKALQDTVNPRIKNGLPDLSADGLTDELLKGICKIHVVACGTASYAGMVGQRMIEQLARIPVQVSIASEFRYSNPILAEKELVVFISQSGETLDTLAALRLVKQRNIPSFAIVNVVGSSIAREADSVLYTWAGPEIAVASTKAYTVQLGALCLFALKLAWVRGALTAEQTQQYIKSLTGIPEKMEQFLKQADTCKHAASLFQNAEHLFFMGRGLDYAMAMEGALKLKEISYIHSEAYAAGELKHGTISLITDHVPVVVIATQSNVYEKTLSNVKEVVTRGAKVLLIVREDFKVPEDMADFIVSMPTAEDVLMPLLGAIPLQLFAYYTAVLRGCDVDKPRNLAKSVTVE